MDMFLKLGSALLFFIPFLYEVDFSKSRFGYFRPQLKFCGWAYKVAYKIWNFVPNLKIGENRRSLMEVQITT